MMDALDRALLNRMQAGLPLTPSPYMGLGMELGLTEDQVLKRIQRLQVQGYIRRIGGTFDSEKLGYTSVLCALKIPVEAIEYATQIINQYSGVTHNYLRDHEYNIWFTLTTSTKELQEGILEDIQKATNCQMVRFPAVRKYKIRAVFDVKEVTEDAQ